MEHRIGTAGWSLPREQQPRFPTGDSHLARYAQVLNAVEINSTFHRSHRPATYERWAATVPDTFQFSIKLPRAITHYSGLVRTQGLLDAFFAEIAPLGEKAGCLLVQLPPKLEFTLRTARSFVAALRDRFDKGIAIEPRHASWFNQHADRMLEALRVTRVVADPLRSPEGAEPGGWKGLAYFRLHGSPRTYYSSYTDEYLDQLAERLRALGHQRVDTWCIFDNTTLGAGTANALDLQARLAPSLTRDAKD